MPNILAELQFEDFLHPLRRASGSARDYFIILGAVAVLTGVLVLIVLAIKKARRERRHHHHHHRSAESPAAATSGPEAGSHHHRRRRRRREHRPRNPTLAETGGLPPPRPEKPMEPSS